LKREKKTAGNRPADGGHLIIDSQEEYEDFIKREPKAKKFIKRLNPEKYIAVPKTK